MGGPVQRTGSEGQIDWVSRESYEGTLRLQAAGSFFSIGHFQHKPLSSLSAHSKSKISCQC